MAIFPLEEETILLPLTSKLAVRFVKSEGKNVVPLYLKTCPTAGLVTLTVKLVPFPNAAYTSLKLSLILSPPIRRVSPVSSLAVVPRPSVCLAITRRNF